MDLYQEAQQVIDDSKLGSIFMQFGEVQLEGSFVYKTMVDRDIDYTIIVPEDAHIDFSLRTEFGTRLLELPDLSSLQMSDRHHFPTGSQHAIDGIWFGLTLISQSTSERWNVDAWLMKRGGNHEADNSLVQRLMNLTEQERALIVDIKQQSLDAGLKQKGQTSFAIYDAVLNRGVRSYDDYLQITR